jgi:hypothetical protein
LNVEGVKQLIAVFVFALGFELSALGCICISSLPLCLVALLPFPENESPASAICYPSLAGLSDRQIFSIFIISYLSVPVPAQWLRTGP